MFDADEYLEALEPPVFKYGGRVYSGRVLSMEQWMRFAPALQKSAKGELDYVSYQVLVWQLGRAMFPQPWWRFWEKSVGRILLTLPLKAREAALQNFLASQGRALGLRTSTEVQTPGSS